MRSAPGTPAAIAICFGSELAAVEAAAHEPAAEARHVEQTAPLDPGEGVVDVGAHVAAQQDRQVVRLEHGLRRIARKAPARRERGPVRAAVVREMAPRGRGHEAARSTAAPTRP